MANNKQVSYAFWGKSPNLKLIRQQAPQVEGNRFLNYFWQTIKHLSGSPFIEFLILDELLDCLYDYKDHRLNSIAFDVLLQQNAFKDSPMFKDRMEYFLRELGAWLTQQIAAIRIEGTDSKSQIPETVIRCLWDNREIIKNAQIRFHHTWKIYGFTHPNIKKEPYFKIVHPLHQYSVPKPALFTIISPEELPVNELDLDFDQNSILGTNLLDLKYRSILPLVTDQHTEILSICYPSDGTRQLWIRHIGEHETWVGDKLSFKPISHGLWFPLFSGNIIILGRIIQKDSNQEVLPGSLVIKVGKNDE